MTDTLEGQLQRQIERILSQLLVAPIPGTEYSWTFAERFSCIDDCSTKSEGWNLVTAPYWGPLVQDRLNIPKWAIRWFSISLRECERCNHLTLCTSCLGSRGVTIIAQSGGPGSLNPEGKCWILETSAGRHMAQLARPDTAGSPLLGWNVERALYEAWDMSEQLQIRKVLPHLSPRLPPVALTPS